MKPSWKRERTKTNRWYMRGMVAAIAASSLAPASGTVVSHSRARALRRDARAFIDPMRREQLEGEPRKRSPLTDMQRSSQFYAMSPRLLRRVAYGGNKGRRALRRLRVLYSCIDLSTAFVTERLLEVEIALSKARQ